MKALLLISIPVFATVTVAAHADINYQTVLRDKDIAIKKTVAIIGTISNIQWKNK
jgi:hypothetical protein